MIGPVKRKVPIKQLLSALDQFIEAGPRRVDQLVSEFGYTAAAIRVRLEQLEREQRVHRVNIPREHSHGLCQQWRHGVAPGTQIAPQIALGQELPSARQRVTVPAQAVVRTWPKFCRRDPLVAALFGPARQEASWA